MLTTRGKFKHLHVSQVPTIETSSSNIKVQTSLNLSNSYIREWQHNLSF